jgi:serine/threonine protein phosphatase PrpC
MSCNVEAFASNFVALQAHEIIKKKWNRNHLLVVETELLINSINELNYLIDLYFSQNKADRQVTREDMRTVGENLNSIGGYHLMLLVCQCLTTNEDAPSLLNSVWDGIGGWAA